MRRQHQQGILRRAVEQVGKNGRFAATAGPVEMYAFFYFFNPSSYHFINAFDLSLNPE